MWSPGCLRHVVYLRTGCPCQGTKKECTRAAEQVGVGLAGCAKLENLGWRRIGEQEGRRDSGVLKGKGRKQRRNSPGLRPKREAWNPWWMRSRVILQNPGEPGKQNDYLIASPDLRVDALSPIARTGQDTCKTSCISPSLCDSTAAILQRREPRLREVW